MVLLAMVQVAYASTCGDTVDIGKNCTMLTPELTTCTTYNYSVYNTTAKVENGSLTLISDSIYYFTFNQSEGDYIVKLCDGSTREIKVTNGMIAESIIYSILLLLLAGFFITSLALAFYLDGENKFTMGDAGDPILEINLNKYAKLFLYLLSYLFLWMLTWTSWQVSDTFLLFDGLTNILRLIFIVETIAWVPIILIVTIVGLTKHLADADLIKTTERNLPLRK